MMPSAPVAFSAGIISRATDSSMIVSTAIQPLPLKPETVGLRKAGSFFNTFETVSYTHLTLPTKA